MVEFPLDSAIIAVIISSVIASLIVLIREKKIEPERWKKTTKLQTIEKRLKAYDELLNFLRTAEERAKNWGDDLTHSFERPNGTEEFKAIFQRNFYLFSSKLNQLYFNAIKSDTRFGLTPRHESSQKHSTIFTHFSMNLQEM